MEDKTALSYWFPRLEAAGLPVPKTIIIPMPELAQENVWAAFDGRGGTADQWEAMNAFTDEIRRAAESLGVPCFLRTDHTSGKHGWEDTCYLPDTDELTIASHITSIATYSEMVSLVGLPWSVWAVREFLPTIPLGVCPRYGNMPICKEFRFFVEDDRVRCWHPYWPLDALKQGGGRAGLDYAALCRMDNEAELCDMASAAGKAVGGAWSVDLLETAGGWFITDMAEAEKSFHWGGCPEA